MRSDTRSSVWGVALLMVACSSRPAGEDEGGETTTPGSTSGPGTAEAGDTDEADEADEGPSTDEDTSGETGVPTDLAVVGCDLWAPDCPADHKCVPFSSSGGAWDGAKCVPILGDGEHGDPCVYQGRVAATDDCGPGLVCWAAVESEGELLGECAPVCTGQGPPDWLCPPGTSCVFDELGLPAVCALTCDPLLQDCPAIGAGQACSWSGQDFVCVASEGVALGQPCAGYESCAAGLICLEAEVVPGCAGESCCAAFCDLVEPSCATPGTECESFFEEGVGWNWGPGVCTIPGR